jgi:hypothetical protein
MRSLLTVVVFGLYFLQFAIITVISFTLATVVVTLVFPRCVLTDNMIADKIELDGSEW